MNAPAVSDRILPALGQIIEGGHFGGTYMHGGERRGLAWAPKSLGHFAEVRFNRKYGRIDGALSEFDGLANTKAMAGAGSELAQKIGDLRIGGRDDWALPALDQLELGYRLLKPGTSTNSCYMRSGINLSSVPQGLPYTEEDPLQTAVEIFRAGAPEAFEEDLYWTSTCYRAGGNYAWGQSFSYGDQDHWDMGGRLFARACRSFPI